MPRFLSPMRSQASPTSTAPSPRSQGQPTETSALRKIMWFGIIQIAGLVAGSIVAFYAFAAVFSSIASLGLGPNPTPAQVGAALGPFFQSFVFVVPVTVIVELMATVVLMFALRDLARVDRDGFATPSILVIIGIAGILLAGVGGTLLLGSLPDPDLPGSRDARWGATAVVPRAVWLPRYRLRVAGTGRDTRPCRFDWRPDPWPVESRDTVQRDDNKGWGDIYHHPASEHRGADPSADRSARGEGSAGEAVSEGSSQASRTLEGREDWTNNDPTGTTAATQVVPRYGQIDFPRRMKHCPLRTSKR